MCSQRAVTATTRRTRARGLVLAVVKRDRPHFLARIERGLLRLAVKVHLVAFDLVTAMLARGLDDDGVFAALHRLGFVVLAVPPTGIPPRRPRRRREWSR